MNRRQPDFGAPPELAVLMSYLEFLDSDRREFIIARELVEQTPFRLDRNAFQRADDFVAQLLADETLDNSDLKGLLRRLDRTASWEYGGSPREFFTALRIELATWIKRLR